MESATYIAGVTAIATLLLVLITYLYLRETKKIRIGDMVPLVIPANEGVRHLHLLNIENEKDNKEYIEAIDKAMADKDHKLMTSKLKVAVKNSGKGPALNARVSTFKDKWEFGDVTFNVVPIGESVKGESPLLESVVIQYPDDWDKNGEAERMLPIKFIVEYEDIYKNKYRTEVEYKDKRTQVVKFDRLGLKKSLLSKLEQLFRWIEIHTTRRRR